MKSPTEITWKNPQDLIYGARLVNPKKSCEGLGKVFDKNRAWFIGLVHALAINNNFFSILTNPALTKADIAHKLKKEFDSFNWPMADFVKFIESMGKSIPEYIYNQTVELRLAYLSGLTDSQYTFWPLNFAKEIQLLMYSCGLQARIRKYEHGYCVEPNSYSYNVYKKLDTLVSNFPDLNKPDLNKSDLWHPIEFISSEITGEEQEAYYVEVDGGQFYCNGYLVF